MDEKKEIDPEREAAVKVLAMCVVRSINHDTTYCTGRSGINWAREAMSGEAVRVAREIEREASRLSLEALFSLADASLAEGEAK